MYDNFIQVLILILYNVLHKFNIIISTCVIKTS